MALLPSLLSTLDKDGTAGLACAFGEPEAAVSRGIQSSIVAVLAGIAGKSEDPRTLGQIMDLAPKTSGDTSWSQIATGVYHPNSSLMLAGEQAISSLFGSSAPAVASALSADSRLRPGVTSTLMTMAAALVISFLGRLVHEAGLTMSSLGSLLESEAPTIRNALPAGVSDLIWPHAAAMHGPSSVVSQTVQRESSSNRWLLPLILLALIPVLFWLSNHPRRPVPAPTDSVQVPPASTTTGTANRSLPDLSNIVRPKLPDRVNLRFDTGSARLTPDSQRQLDNLVADLLVDRNVHITVGGYTDNVGSAEQNLQLSQRRAHSVVTQMVHKGISLDRFTSEGYGEESPVADNTTAAGRAQNRRVSVSAARE